MMIIKPKCAGSKNLLNFSRSVSLSGRRAMIKITPAV
jgi:hypothetical protein